MPREFGTNQIGSRVIYVQTEAAPTITGTLAISLLAPDVTIPAGFLVKGDVIRASLGGVCSNNGPAPGTLQFGVNYGGLGGTVLATSQLMNMSTSAQTDVGWWMQVYITCVTEGTSGQLRINGALQRGNRLPAASEAYEQLIPHNDALPAGAYSSPPVINLAVPWTLTFTTKNSIADGANSITCYSYILEALN